ncbi:polyprenyl synthetase family protein, partial [Neisseria dentiae]|uniref:polyprenyl synthetase family protein n=1 Tax=Neisseria dentiae TaxID=194197 RepID=UPI0035A031B1
MSKANDLKAWQQKAQAQTELVLERLMPSEHMVPQTLHQAMRYVTLGGGKRLRPLLVLAASELGQADQTAVEYAMAAVEMIHVYSLVHDDMPA